MPFSRFKYIVLPAAILVSSQSFAQGPYLFGELGQSSTDVGPVPAGFTADDTDTSFNIGLGYGLTDNFAIEGGYTDLGEASISTSAPINGTYLGSSVSVDGTLGADLSGFTLGAKLGVPLSDTVSLYGRAGFFFWESDASISGTVTVDGASYTGSSSAKLDDGVDEYFGAGVEVQLTEALALTASVTRYSIDLLQDSADVDSVALGLKVAF